MIELKLQKPIEVGSFGDFKVEKKYYVPNSKGGKIIQIIRRNTEFTDYKGFKYSTTENINEYTSGNVKFTNDDYVEVFQMIKGKSCSDIIQNGALVRYDDENLPIIYDSIHDNERLPYLTNGMINVIGINYYLPTDKYREFSKKFNPIPDIDGPANGLPAFPIKNEEEFKNVVEWLKKNSEYEPVNHIIEVKWNYNKTILSNYVNKTLDEEIIHNHYIDLEEYKKKSKSPSPKSPSPKSPSHKSPSPKSKSHKSTSPKSRSHKNN